MAADPRADRTPPADGDEQRRLRRLVDRLLVENRLYTAEGDPFAEQRETVTAPVRRLFTTFGRRYWRSFGVGIGAGVLARALDLLPPILLGIAVDAVLLENRAFGLPGVPDAWIPTSTRGQFWLSVGLIAAAFVGTSVFNWLRARGLNAFAQHVQHDLRTGTYDRIQRLQLAFFDEKQTGELMSVLSSNVNDLNSFLKDSVDQILQLAVTVGGVGIVLFSINPQLALVSMSTTPLVAVMTFAYVRTVKPRYKRVRESLGDLFSRLENNLTGIQVIKTSGTEDFERDRVAAASGEYRERNWDVLRLSTVFGPAQQAMSGLTFVLTFVVGGLWVTYGAPPLFSGTLSVGEFVAFLLLSQRFVAPMSQFGNLLDNYQRTHASAERVFGLLDEVDAAEFDAPDAEPLDAVEGRVEYDGVSFAYGGKRDGGESAGGDSAGGEARSGSSSGAGPGRGTVLDGVSFAAEPGETVALVGPSGSGKSTTLKLLPRLYDPGEGTVSLDGRSVDTVTRASLRSAIGYVSQEPFMFFGTVRENIAYGVDDATDEEIERAARAANAHRFVAQLPEGYDTPVGQRGGKLSGGQRQRLSIARAVLRDPEILILDEATSAVDTETELLIQTALERVTEGRTTFAIAHRLSTIRDADTILVFEDGRIVERGTHDELLGRDGLYAHLWQVQAGLLDDLPAEFVERVAERAAQPRSGTGTEAGAGAGSGPPPP